MVKDKNPLVKKLNYVFGRVEKFKQHN